MSPLLTRISVGQCRCFSRPLRQGVRATVVALAILGFVAVAGSTVAAQASRQPNVVIIVSDDQGYHDLGCYGSDEVIAPNLDRLAAEGVRLTDFYVTWPACTPSRGGLLTGRYPQRNGIYDMIRNEAPDYGKHYAPAEYAVTFERIGGMDTREVLLPSLLHDAGYTSGIFGKWDLGIHRRFLPLARGFDDFYGFVNTGIDYYTHERYGVPSMFRNDQLTQEDKGTYCTDLFEREALRFVDEHHDRPFFLYLPFNAPHNASNLDSMIRSGAQAPDKYKAMYPHLKEGSVSGTQYGEPAERATRDARRLRYLASITAMDEAIGEILSRIEQYGLTDDTLVVFFSDNGGGGGSDNQPLRGGKSKMFEGGIRVPCIVRFPGRVPAGSVCDQFLTSLEVFPTVLQVAGIDRPNDIHLDGFDMLPVLAGRKPSQRTEMFWQRRADVAARVGNWKWVDSEAGSGLFDLSTDIGEGHDRSEQDPEVLRMVKQRFDNWTRQMEQAEPRGPFRDY